MLWSDLPEAERARLIRNEAAQRRETAKRGLPALPCSPEALFMLQRGMCCCNECRGAKPLIVGEIVIAHVYFRAGKGSPGHVPHNLSLWNDACNRREAGLETSALASGKRMAVKKDRAGPKAEPRRESGFSKPAGYVSPLSKASDQYKRAKAYRKGK